MCGLFLCHLLFKSFNQWNIDSILISNYNQQGAQQHDLCDRVQSLDKSHEMKALLTFSKVPLRQVMSLSGHLWNASRACKCSSYLFERGNCQIVQNCSPTLGLNFIFDITNEIWQLSHKSCLFCSNSVTKKVIIQARPASAQAQS